jgi:hypothetical protein
MSDWQIALDNVPWQQVKSFQGNCSHIPNAIKNLSSGDVGVRDGAYWSIDNHVVVQGGLQEGAFFVIPFLVRFSVSISRNGCREALALLYEIANGSASLDNTVRFREVSNPFAYYIPDETACSLPLPVAVRGAVGRELGSIVPLAACESEDVRDAAQELLSSFPEMAYGLSQHLDRIAEGLSAGQAKTSVCKLVNSFRR